MRRIWREKEIVVQKKSPAEAGLFDDAVTGYLASGLASGLVSGLAAGFAAGFGVGSA
jgi:hypothetical protein